MFRLDEQLHRCFLHFLVGEGWETLERRPDWQLLCVAPNEMEAHLIRGRLESAGIPVYLSGESVARLYGFTTGHLARVRVFVPVDHVADARALLQSESEALPPE